MTIQLQNFARPGAAAAGTDSRFPRMAWPASWLHQACVCLSTFLPETGRGFGPGTFLQVCSKLLQQLTARVGKPQPNVRHVSPSVLHQMSTGGPINVAATGGKSVHC